MNLRLKFFATFLGLAVSVGIFAQNEPVVIEAEDGTLGSDYQEMTDGDVTYIAPQTNFINTTNPGDASKITTFDVTFADSGTYKLYVRLRVGPNGFDDDSYYYGNGFGTKDASTDADWVICNGLAAAGFTINDDVVEGQGDGGSDVWKWVAFSDFTGMSNPITFRVEPDALNQTFQIGAREDGLDIDKIAFGRAGVFYTVKNLDNGEAGTTTHPGAGEATLPLAYGLDKFLGCGYGPDSKRDFANYWNQVTPGNAGKWGSVEGTRDNMNWTAEDEAYNFAKDNGFMYKHHVMVWGSQQPNWMASLDSADQRTELDQWFAAVAERYPDLDQVEVVNEALHQPPTVENSGGYIGALGGTGKTGWDWVLEAFRMANKVFPDSTMLMINEYGILNSTQNTDDYLKIIKLLQAENLIDGIGFQAHGFSQNGSNATFLRNIDTLASTGLPIYVTEFDVDGLTDLQQVHTYMNLFPLLWEHPAIKGITLWGFRPAMWRGDQGAYLIDNQGVERPAMLWLRAYLKNAFVANQSISMSSAGGATSIDAPAGTLQLTAEVSPDTSTIKTVNWKVNQSSIATIDQNGLLTAVSNGVVTVTAMSLELGSKINATIDIEITNQNSAIHANKLKEVKVYPNPASHGNISIEGVDPISSIKIYDLRGVEIKNIQHIDNTRVDMNLNIEPGLYLFKICEGNDFTFRKIILE